MLNESKKKEFIKKFGEVVGRIKIEKRLSYRKIAAQCDLNASYLGKIEKGAENIL